MRSTEKPPQADGSNNQAYPIIGVGFSAGGLDAFKQFLSGVNSDSQAAYVIIQHLPDEDESHLLQIIEAIAPLPVIHIEDGSAVQPGKIHVLRASSEVSVREGIFHLSDGSWKQAHHNSLIDHFFGSLARDEAEMVVGVILSGTGSDGTVGLQKIKAAGGICLAQDPAEAQFPGMPQSAINSGCVDFVGPVDKLAPRADRYFDMRNGSRITADSLDSDKESTLIRMLCLVRARTGNDFRSYKRSSILRRVERRMSIVDTSDFEDYLEYLRQLDKEVKDLARDILISVTCFFRDSQVWQALEGEVIPRILETKEDGDDIRVWVPGCATGEEAYSYGIVFSEAIERSGKSISLQIYGTDLDDYSRGIARAANYPLAIANDVGEAYFKKYFEFTGQGRCSIIKSLREKVVFAKQNILSDPPFSRMDLVSCRNLLIYLDANMQKRVINLLHFALNEGGVAVLGSAESAGQPKDLFKPLDRDLRIFERIGKRSSYPPDGRGNVFPSPHKQADRNLSLPNVRPRLRSIEETSRNLIMEHFDAASALVDENLNIRYLSGRTSHYLKHPEGTPSNDLSILVSASVGHKIRSFAKQVLAKNEPHRFLADLNGAKTTPTQITLKPIRLEDGEDGLFIIFESMSHTAEQLEKTSAASGAEASSNNKELVGDMDRELKETQDELRSIVEDLASTNEELKSANEEVMSMNEELQSSNEELETSKEELQSLNDELSNVNKDLSSKVSELEATNNDMHNLLTSTDIATIFLDDKLRIKRFTAACSRLFSLIPSDVGRPLSDLVAKFDGDNLVGLCHDVLDDLKSREDEIQATDDAHYLRRITPYRTKDNRIEGIVITFYDVSLLKRAEADLLEAERCLRLAIQNSPVIIFAQNRDLEYTYILNQPPAYPADEVLGKTDRELLPNEYQELESLKKQVMETGETLRKQISVRVRPQNRRMWIDITIEPLKDKDGRITGIAGATVDITDRVEREAELEAASKAKTRFLSSMSHDIRTPLTAIMGLAEVLEEILDRDHREIGEEIKNSCQHLISTLDSVLKLAHLQGGEVKLPLVPIHLNKIFEDVCNNFDPARKRKNGEARIRVLIEDGDLHVMAEYGALLRVLGNLVGNALKFCPEAPVTLRAKQESEAVIIRVEDRGPGIGKDFIQDLFKPFTQESDSKKSSLPGSGLGLSISYELVQLMNGSIDVDSRLGEGTTMILRLPAGQNEHTPAANTKTPPTNAPARNGDPRVVICDDHEATCKVISRMLRNQNVVVVSSEAQLFEQLDDAEILLLDINLNGRDRGLKIMKKLRADDKFKDLCIIAFTAHAMPEQKEKFIEAGFDDYLSKPFQKQELLDKINLVRKP